MMTAARPGGRAVFFLEKMQGGRNPLPQVGSYMKQIFAKYSRDWSLPLGPVNSPAAAGRAMARPVGCRFSPKINVPMKAFPPHPLTLLASLCLLGLTWFYVGCGDSPQQQQATLNPTPVVRTVANGQVTIPKLLPRHEQIGTAKEQETMTQTYHQLVQTIAADPTDYRSRIKLAQVYMVEARATGEHGHYYPATLTVLDEILAAHPPQDVVFATKSLKASVMLSLHEFQQAKVLAESAIALNGHNALIYGSLVDAHVELGNYEEAVKMADKMVSMRPDLRSYSRISYLREIHGDMPGAIKAMKMAIQAGYPGYEDRAWCRLTLGDLYQSLGQLDSAKLQYDLALAERPAYPFAKAARAQVYEKQGKLQMAENELRAAIETIPEVGFYEQLAGLYQATERFAESQDLIADIMAMLADDEAAGHRMGMAYASVYLHLVGNLDKAFAYAQAEYERRPRNIEVNRLMAEILYQQGHTEAARQYVEEAMRTGSQDPELLCTAGVIYAALDQADKGQPLIEQSFALNPHQDHSLVPLARQLIDG